MSYHRYPWLWGALAGAAVLLWGTAVALLAGLALLVLRTDASLASVSVLTPVQTALPLVGVNRIVVVDESGVMRTLDPEGGNRRRYNLSGLSFRFPAWAPDGRHLAAIGSEGDEAGVYVLEDADDPQATALYLSENQPPFYLYWAPDGASVSFLANDAEDGIGLWLAQRDPKPNAAKLAAGQPFYWQWMPDGDHVLAHSGGGDEAQLAILPVDGGAAVSVAQPGAFQAPGVSRNGRFLAYAEATSGSRSQVVVTARQGDVRWTAAHAGVAALNWSPVADVLAFVSPPTDAPHFYGPLRLLDANTGEERTVTTRTVLAFFWSPDGRSIAFLTPAGNGGDSGALLSPGRSSVRRGAVSGAQEEGLMLDLWQADAKSGRLRLLTTFQPTALFLTQFLPYFDQYNLSHRLWSPSSDALVIPVRETGGRERVYIIPTDGQKPRPLIEGSIGFWSPR